MNPVVKNCLIVSICLLTWLVSCEPEQISPPQSKHVNPGKLKTRSLVIVVIDGPRFKETWGDPTREHIPYFANELAAVGIHHTRFYNRGATYTSSGHTAITTGNYQWMANDGSEIPYHPSIFQAWLKNSRENSNKALIVASKRKLEVLADCVSPELRGKYNPMINAMDRDDKETLQVALSTMQLYHPRMTLIHFRGPDMYGHANDWENYLNSIKETDRFTYEIWNFLQTDSFYREATTLIATNDHGRHNDSVRDGFISHGDFCEGCMHINFFAAGPDFRSNTIISKPGQLVDIAPTIAVLLGFEQSTFTGSVMWELFKQE